jgi:hypothetical protein
VRARVEARAGMLASVVGLLAPVVGAAVRAHPGAVSGMTRTVL